MKKLWMVSMVVIGITSVNLSAQSITVASDRNPDTDFTKYKTYDFASQVDNELDEGLYFLNDLVFKGQIRDAVNSELMGLGYKQTDDNPDLVVNFRVFDQATRIRGTEDYGTGYWGTDNYRSISDTTSYEVEPGTLMISLVDKKTGSMVWHGFASGLIDNNAFIKDEGKIREAVNLIFDEYGLRAREYSKRD
jgi:hypothetical protein